MREIKFRAWDKKLNIMVKVVSLDWDKRAVGTDLDWAIHKGNGDSKYPLYPMSDYDLMQFTGLHDKNGREIYEGDIVKYKTGSKVVSELMGGDGKWHDEYSFRVVEYHTQKNGVMIHPFMFSNDNCNRCSPLECEIVGTVHENPKLLNAGGNGNDHK